MKKIYPVLFLWLATAALLQAAEDIIPAYTPPSDQKIAPLELPQTFQAELDNGLQITVIPQHEVPTVSFTLAVAGGALLDPAGKEGTAMLTAGLLDRGTNNHSGDEIAEQLEFMATSISAWADMYNSYARFGCLTRYLEPTLELFSEVLQQPQFPEDQFANALNRTISSKQQRLDNPGHLTRKEFRSAVYRGSRYAIAASGNLETVPSISRDDLVRYHNSFYTPSGAELMIVGNVDPEEMVSLVEKHLGSWSGSNAVKPEPQSPQAGGREVILINKPEATNATLRFGHLGVPRSNPDYYALQVMNSILGGSGFSSRLMQRIRTELGFTYGIYSGFRYNRDTGYFSIGGAVSAANLHDTVREALAIIDNIRTVPVTDAELQNARTFLAASYPLAFEDPEHLAFELLESHTYGIPESDILEYSTGIMAVTKEDVLRVAAEYITPGSFKYIICGNSDEVLPQAERLGEVTVMEIN